MQIEDSELRTQTRIIKSILTVLIGSVVFAFASSVFFPGDPTPYNAAAFGALVFIFICIYLINTGRNTAAIYILVSIMTLATFVAAAIESYMSYMVPLLFTIGIMVAVSIAPPILILAMAITELAGLLILATVQYPIFNFIEVLQPYPPLPYISILSLMAASSIMAYTWRVSYGLQKRKIIASLDQERVLRKRHQEMATLLKLFSVNTSHDVLPVLNVTLSDIERVSRGDSGSISPEMKDFLERSHKRINRANSTLSKAIQIGKLYSGQYPVIYVNTSITELADSVMEIVEPLAKKKKINIQSEIFDGDAELDPDILYSILFNLITNAIKYSPEDSKIRLVISGEEDKILRIVVADEGRGIPKAAQDKIFMPYQQVYETDKSSGNGLGLAFVKQYVELLNGQIELESRQGEGSTFTILIPYR